MNPAANREKGEASVPSWFHLFSSMESSSRDMLAVVITRAIMFFVLFAVALQFRQEALLRSLIIIYGLSTIFHLAIWVWAYRSNNRSPVGFLLYFQLLVELSVETAIFVSADGYASQYGLLFILTILTTGMFFLYVGASVMATIATLIFLAVGLSHWEAFPWNFLLLPPMELQLVEVQFLLHTTLFYLVAFLSSHFSARLLHARQELEGTHRELDFYQFSAENMMNSIPNGLLFFDYEGKLKYWNSQSEMLLGQSLVVGEFMASVFPESALPSDPLSTIHLRSQDPGKPGMVEFDLPEIEGRSVHVQARAIVREDFLLGFVFTLLDFTELKRMESALLRSERMAALGEMSAKIAHEIRNPLASITGSAQMLEQGLPPEDTDRKLFHLIIHESRRLNRFLTSLLEYAREKNPTFRRVSVDEIFRKIRFLVEKNPNFDAQLVQFSYSIAPEDLGLVTDRDVVTQVILNVCLNGIQALPSSGGSVELAARAVESGVRFCIKDTGKGMTESEKARAFEPFYTTKTSGTGLGLSVCLQLVQKLEGAINLHSIPGKGTEVVILLPHHVQ